MNFKQLKYFLKTVETGNLTRAAAALNVAQTALGLQIKNLEAEFGTPLIKRHSRGVKLTAAGVHFAQRADEIQNLIDETCLEMHGFKNAQRVPLRFGLTPSIIDMLGASIVEKTSKIQHLAAATFVEGLSFKLMSSLEEDEIDCALAFNISDNSKATRFALLEEKLFFVGPPDAERNWRPISFKDALAPNLALLSRRDIIWRIVHDAAKFLSLDVTVEFEVQSQSAIKKLVKQGVATSIMPYGAMYEDAHAGQICARPIDNTRLVRTLFFVLSRTAERIIPAEVCDILVPSILDEYRAKLGNHAVPLSNRMWHAH